MKTNKKSAHFSLQTELHHNIYIIVIMCSPLPDSRATCTSWNFSTGSTSRRNLANASAITCTLLYRQTILKSKKNDYLHIMQYCKKWEIFDKLPAYCKNCQKDIENIRKLTCTLQVTKISRGNEGFFVNGRAFWSEKVRKSGGVCPHLFCDNGGGDGDGEIRSCHS